MKNTILSYSNLKGDVKKAFKNWLLVKNPSLISFPFKGRHVKGYVFDYETCRYLVVMYLATEIADNFDMNFVQEDF